MLHGSSTPRRERPKSIPRGTASRQSEARNRLLQTMCCLDSDCHCRNYLASERGTREEGENRVTMFTQIAFIVAFGSQAFGPSPLDSRLHDLVAAHKGKVAIACAHLVDARAIPSPCRRCDADCQSHQVSDHDRGLLPGQRRQGQAGRHADADQGGNGSRQRHPHATLLARAPFCCASVA